LRDNLDKRVRLNFDDAANNPAIDRERWQKRTETRKRAFLRNAFPARQVAAREGGKVATQARRCGLWMTLHAAAFEQVPRSLVNVALHFSHGGDSRGPKGSGESRIVRAATRAAAALSLSLSLSHCPRAAFDVAFRRTPLSSSICIVRDGRRRAAMMRGVANSRNEFSIVLYERTAAPRIVA